MTVPSGRNGVSIVVFIVQCSLILHVWLSV